VRLSGDPGDAQHLHDARGDRHVRRGDGRPAQKRRPERCGPEERLIARSMPALPGARARPTDPRIRAGRSEIERLEEGAEVLAQLLVLQGELDGRLEEPELVPGVVPLAAETVREDAPAPEQAAQAVGELDLSTAAPPGFFQRSEDLRRKYVAP